MHIIPRKSSTQGLMDEVFDDFDTGFRRLVVSPLRGSWPSVDVRETEKAVTVEMEAPGIDPEGISISVEGLYLKVEGSKEEKKEEKNENYFRREIYRGTFSRIVSLPCAVDERTADAEYEKGILRITLEKKTAPPEQKIKVRVK